MFKKILVMAIAGMVFNLATAQVAFADTKGEKLTEKVRSGVLRLGAGPDARVEVKLKDKMKIKGYIVEANATEFVVMNSKTGEAVPVAYSAVKQIRGNNVSTGVKIIIGVALVLAAILIITAVAASQLE